jgi:hypothetical protein
MTFDDDQELAEKLGLTVTFRPVKVYWPDTGETTHDTEAVFPPGHWERAQMAHRQSEPGPVEDLDDV